jgi:muramidase (phage lysozyme)
MDDANLQAADLQAPPGLLLAALNPQPAADSSYQAPADLKQPLAVPPQQRGPTGPTGLGKEIADATFSGLIKPDLAQKAGVPPEGMALLNWVMKGESHGFNELYRGTHFSDFSDHPANLGWHGDVGPDGRPTSAAGGPQFERATWNEAKNTLGLTDFSDVSQTKAGWWLAQRDYNKRTGRDLGQDLKEGHLDQLVSGLKDTWPSLGKGNEGDQTMYGNQSWGRGMADELRRQGEGDAQRIEGDRAQYLAAAEKAPAGSAERMEMLHEAHEASRRATEQYDKLLKSPPIYQPTDAFAGFGGIIMALAAFAGGRAAQPLTGALTAMSGALDGMNQGNKEAYDRAFHIWDMQTEGALKLVNIQNNEIRNVLEDQRMADNEKAAHLQTLFAGYQMDQSASALREGNWMKVWQMHESSERLAQEAGTHAEHVREFNETYQQRERLAKDRQTPSQIIAKIHDDIIQEWQSQPENEGKDPPPDVDASAWEQARQRGATGSAGKIGKPQMLDIGGKQVYAQEVSPGNWVDATTGAKIDIPPGTDIGVVKSPGRQAAAQVNSMINAGNEAVAAVGNLVDLPITATAGWFKGQGQHPGDTPTEALKRSLVNEVTLSESRSITTSFQGVARAMATLEAAGRATGLVGLTQQAQLLMPQQGDTGLDILRKYAEIRQLTERSLETMKASPDVSKDQQKLMEKIAGEMRDVVPWTVKDINALQRDPSAEKVDEFARRFGASGAATADIPPSWSTKTAVGPKGEKIYSDGQGWFHIDHTPVQ